MNARILLLLGAFIFNASAVAENWYIDGGLGFISFDDGVDEVNPTNLYLRGGYIINENINIGLESNVTLSPDEFLGVDFDVNIGTIYIRVGAPVNEKVWLYAQIGKSNTELVAEQGGLSVSADDDDTMIGFGMDIGLGNNQTYLAFNFSAYNDNDGVEVGALNLGIGTRF